MSDLTYRGQIAVPKYVTGDLSQAYAQGTQLGQRDRQLDLMEDQAKQRMAMSKLELEYKRDALQAQSKKAQADAMKAVNAERFKIQGMLGGIMQEAHPLATPLVQEAYGKLQQDLVPLMFQEGGAEAAKFYINNFTRDLEKYLINSDMRDAESNMTAMIDPSSAQYLDADKQLGALYHPVVTPLHVKSAQDYQYKGLMQDMRLEYKNGSFSIMGRQVDPEQNVANEFTDVFSHPKFNDKNVFSYSTERVSGTSFEALGQAIKTAEKGKGDAFLWDWDRITDDYSGYHSGQLNFEGLDRASDGRYQFRFQSFIEGQDALRSAFPQAQSMSPENLLQFYTLNPNMRAGYEGLFDAVQQQITTNWEQKVKPHSKYGDAPDAADVQVTIKGTATEASLAYTDLPTDPQTREIPSSLLVPDDVASNDRKMKSVEYGVQNLPNNVMENLKVTVVNPQYYNKLRLYEGLGLIQYTPNGRPILTDDAGEGLTPEVRQGIADLMGREDLMVDATIQSLKFYEGNPTTFGINAGRYGVHVVDANAPDSHLQSLLNAVNTGLLNGGLTYSDLFDHAQENFFYTTAESGETGWTPGSYNTSQGDE